MVDDKKEYGIWSRANKIVKELKDNGHFVIDRKEISDRLDAGELDPEYCIKFVKDFASSCALFENNYRSVVRSKEIYIDLDEVRSPDIRDRLQQNATLDAERITAIVEKIKSLPIPQGGGGQRAFTFGENGELVMFDELSSNELLEMLVSLQGES